MPQTRTVQFALPSVKIRPASGAVCVVRLWVEKEAAEVPLAIMESLVFVKVVA